MGNNKIWAAFFVGGLTATMALSTASASAGQGDLNCGDEGTYPNMTMTVFDPEHQPGEEGYDPHGLDDDKDGIGCEDSNAPMPGDPGHPETPPTDEPPAQEEEMPVAPPAPPVEAEPNFTG